MLLANDLAGVTASAVLQPSRDAVGAAELIVKTSLDRVAGSVVIDNRGSPYTGPWEATGRVDLNTPFGLGERLSASATVTRRPRELRSFGLGYAHPLGANGLRLDLDLGYALSEPGFTLRRFEVETTSLSADLGLSYPIIRSRDQTLSLGGGLSFLDSEVDLLGSRFSRDRLRSARLELTYGRRGLIGGSSSSSLALRLTQGLPVLNATDPDRDATSRADTEPTYAKVTLDLVHFQPLIDRLGLLLSLGGQYAPRPLPAAEEFALGGARYGRAYDPAEITGEQGIALSLELGYDLFLDETFVRRVSPFLFYDIGKAWDQASSASLGLSQSLSSAGLGVRIDFDHGASLDLEFARPLTRTPSTNTGGGGRFLIFLGTRF
jgi:hemolysin activation/secretion protein